MYEQEIVSKVWWFNAIFYFILSIGSQTFTPSELVLVLTVLFWL